MGSGSWGALTTRGCQCPGCGSECFFLQQKVWGPEEEEEEGPPRAGQQPWVSKVKVILVFHRVEGKVWRHLRPGYRPHGILCPFLPYLSVPVITDSS